MENTEFEIAGKKYDVVKTGLAQADQVAAVGRWFTSYGAAAFASIGGEKSVDQMTVYEILGGVRGSLPGRALVDLFQLTFGCDMKVAEKEFDFALLLDGLVSMYQNSPVIKKLAERFFSPKRSEEGQEESSTQSE